ncbi:hypothetical protein Misp01_01150 [Microtetraspora sp. NBRC 13810]|uniref:hypothetical protein n=1 Tax=Microtetraspora sp. NBRC 13810 TaxID=3030990 RepID=UPI0024A13CBF|nr:hypothetical protein [Microtetraspora sp. NBRC 13810]GLW04985.1 hypothetical protein Misp01_01150 [Microtetraspora sp. NBRC 13810]
MTGNGDQSTGPRGRADWIWGTGEVTFRDFAILRDVTVFGHFPVEATIAPVAARPVPSPYSARVPVPSVPGSHW